MVVVSQAKLDSIENALYVGMELHDAYVFAGLTEAEIETVSSNDELQAMYASFARRYEYDLLEKLNAVIQKQVNMGRENALTWMLERVNPRYTNKPQTSLPDIHLHLPDSDTSDIELHP